MVPVPILTHVDTRFHQFFILARFPNSRGEDQKRPMAFRGKTVARVQLALSFLFWNVPELDNETEIIGGPGQLPGSMGVFRQSRHAKHLRKGYRR